MVKKGACSAYEVELMKSMNGSSGMEPLHFVRVVPEKRSPGLSKTHLITELYEGNLEDLLKKPKLHLTAKDVKDLALPLFAGLQRLHVEPGRTQFPGKMQHIDQYRSYHQDIKPGNLLFKRQPEKGYTAVITDMGSVNDLSTIWKSDGWISPEKDQALCAPWTANSIISYNTHDGRFDDLWNMGLVLTCLLKNSPENLIHNQDVRRLTQWQVNLLIQQQMVKERDRSKLKMWGLVRKLLQVNKENRISAQQMREALEKVRV
jgi:serine/threonine protein kinase